MRSVTPMRIAKTGYIIISAVLCVLGIMLIVNPEFSASMLGIICGVVLIAFGIVKLIGYFSKDLYRLAFQYDLVFGIVICVLGVLMLVNPGALMTFICITLGISILADSVFKLQIAIDSRKFGIDKWWLILTFSIISGVFGLILMFRPGESSNVISVILGISLLCDGILNFSTVITAVKIVKNQKPDVIEIDYEEGKEE